MTSSPRPPRTSAPTRTLPRMVRRVTGAIALATAGVTAVVAVSTAGPAVRAGAGGDGLIDMPDLAPVAASTAAPTQFRVATFNVLGHSHTRAGGDRPGYLDSRDRMDRAVSMLTTSAVDVVGFQEFEPIQYDRWALRTGAAWATWPAREVKGATVDSIAWRTSVWTAVEKRLYKAPYFFGKMQDRPYVQLRNNVTGQLVWVINTHNPANSFGDALQWRDASERIQAALVNQLKAQDPTTPVILVGDMNDRDRFYCPVVTLAPLEAANGPFNCSPPSPQPGMQIDWILGTRDITWSGYERINDTITSDHPLYVATATVAPQRARAAGIQRVVVIDAQGVRSSMVNDRRAPAMATLTRQGTSTLEGRPNSKPTSGLSNTLSMLSGRPVGRSGGGHGYARSTDNGSTAHKSAKQYVSSIFDVAHNLGVRTNFFSGDRAANLVARTWDTKAAGVDSWGVDNGRGKITSRQIASDRTVAATARKKLAAGVSGLTVVQLNDAYEAGQRKGWKSRSYVAAVRKTDQRVAGIVNTIRRNPALAASTLIVVTSSVRGAPSSSGFGVPIIVNGPQVPSADLYAMNPGYVRPGRAANGPNPLRTAGVANLVAGALSLPMVPRSRYDVTRTLNVFTP